MKKPINLYMEYQSKNQLCWLFNHSVTDEKDNIMFYALAFKEIITGSESNTNCNESSNEIVTYGVKSNLPINTKLSRIRLPKFKYDRVNLPPFIIHHDSIISKILTVLLVIILIYILIVVPFVIAFSIEISSGLLMAAVTIEITLILFILIRFRTTISSSIDKNYVITNSKLIALDYVTGLFIFDILGSLPVASFGTLFGLQLNRLFLVFKMFKLFNFYRLHKKYKHYIGYGKINFVVLITVLLIIVHILSCLWYGITYNLDDQNNPSTWLNMLYDKYGTTVAFSPKNIVNPHIRNLPTIILYANSFYFVLTSYSTVGFGNISPNTYIETVLSIILMLIGIITYAILLNQMAIIISYSQNIKAESYQNRKSLRKILKKYGLDNKQWTHIIDNYTDNSKYSNISNSISTGFQEQPIMPFFDKKFPIFNLNIRSIQGSILFDDFPVLAHWVKDPIISSAISCMVSSFSLKSNQIFIYPHQPIAHLYTVVRGHIIASKAGHVYRIFGKNYNFGISLNRSHLKKTFKAMKSNYQLQTLTNCTLYSIDLFTYLDTVEIYPEVERIMKKIFPCAFLLYT